mgnify:CR=1 FL=1
MFAFTTARPELPASIREKLRPASWASTRLIPVAAPLNTILVDPGLRRGTHVSIAASTGSGGSSLAWHLLAAPSAQGYWSAVVGIDDPGALAMSEAGVSLSRVLFVPRPRDQWADVVAEFMGDLDIVIVRAPGRPAHAVARRLSALARERRCVLVSVSEPSSRWTQPADLTLDVRTARWRRDPHLSHRDIIVDAGGRLVGPRSRALQWGLPLATLWES